MCTQTKQLSRVTDLITNLDNLGDSPKLGICHEGFDFYPRGSSDQIAAAQKHGYHSYSITRSDGRLYHGYPAEPKTPKVKPKEEVPILVSQKDQA